MKKHYLDLKDMPFYAGLCKYMSSGPVLAMVTQIYRRSAHLLSRVLLVLSVAQLSSLVLVTL